MVAEVVVRKFDAPHEAELAAGYLREHGMPARVDNDVLIGMNPLWAMALGGIRVFVRKIDAERAQELLSELARPIVSAKDDPSEVVRRSDGSARRALAAAVFGIFLLPVVAHAYSLAIVIGIKRAELSARGRRHRAAAIVVDLLALGVFAAIVSR